jgi:hypothetical protein
MDKFIEAIANGNFEAILALVTTLLSGGFGSALVVLATKFLNYKKSVKDTITEAKNKLVPEFKEIADKVKIEIIEEIKADFKVIAESIALSTSNDPVSKIGVIENVSKIGVSKQIQEKAIKVVEEEVKAKEEKKEELNKVVEKLEANTLETL